MIYTIYTQSLCGYCDAAKQLMKECGISYNEISLDNDQDAKNLIGIMTLMVMVLD